MNLILQLFFLMICFCFYFFYIPEGFSYFFILLVFSIASFSIFSHFVLRKESVRSLKGQYLRFSIVFIVGHFIVHFQVYLDYLLGNIDEYNYFIWINSEVVGKALLVSTIALLSYLVFYEIRSGLRYKLVPNTPRKEIDTTLLLLLSIFFLLGYYLTVDVAYISGGYGEVSMGKVPGDLGFLFQNCIGAVVILNCRNVIVSNRKIQSIRTYVNYMKWPIVLILLYLASVILSGDRGPAIYNLAFLFFGYLFVSKSKFSFLKVVFILIISSFMVSLLGAARSLNNEDGFISRIKQTINSGEESSTYPASISPYTKELAASARTVNMAVESDSVFYGLFAFQDVSLLIPSLKGFLISSFDIPRMFTSSAQYLTYYSLGANATWGVGTSSVADAFLNLGIIGVFVIFGVFGWFSRYLEVVSFERHIPHLIVMVAAFSVYSFSIYIPRAGIIYAFSNVFYLSAFVYAATLMARTKFK